MSRYIPYLVIINLGSPCPETNSITARGIALGSEYAYRMGEHNQRPRTGACLTRISLLGCRQRENRTQ